LKKYAHSLPNKENSQVGEDGVRFSDGQKQRMGIARALYFKPRSSIFRRGYRIHWTYKMKK